MFKHVSVQVTHSPPQARFNRFQLEGSWVSKQRHYFIHELGRNLLFPTHISASGAVLTCWGSPGDIIYTFWEQENVDVLGTLICLSFNS